MALSVASFVIDQLKDPVFEEASFLYSVADKVASVRKQLEWIHTFLEAAEKKGKEDKTVRLWVDQVRDVSFRIEDAIDIYLIEVKGNRTTHGGCRLLGFVRWIYKIVTKPVALHNLGVELSDIEATLKEIDGNRQRFNINDFGGTSGQEEKPFRKMHSFEYSDTIEIVGLEDDKKAIFNKLLDPQAQDLHVISIVGTGGLGKTTLARRVFNSAEVRGRFDIRIWLSVSREFNRISILKNLLEKIRTVQPEEKDKDEHYFIKEIRNCLNKKRFLIVLDDVWSGTFWPDIRIVCPPDDEMGCGRVLITTRDINVARKARSEPYKLKFLNLEESKMLLYKVAFPKQEPPRGLDEAATQIAKNCGGLPLAIVVVGGQLYMEHKYSEWRKVAEGVDWQGSDCMQILAASYEDMSMVLKTCFMYLASFLEDDLIDGRSLVRTWVAEGLVPDEVTAQKCLQELAQRCLIIVRETSYDGSVEKFVVHDLLLELAIKEAKEKKFFSVFVKENPEQNFNNARRASLQSCTFDQRNNNNFENKRKVMRNYNKKLRSLLVFGESLPDDLSGFRLLKVLKLHDVYFISSSELKKLCEELIHLRHLEFRNCTVENGEIPESIGHLKNLLSLDCTYTMIEKVPESLWSITTLRHVVLWGEGPRAKGPPPSAKLPNLRTLCNVELEPPSPSPRLDDRSYHFSHLRELALLKAGPWVATLLKELNQLVSLKIKPREGCLPSDVLDMRDFPFYQNLQCLVLEGIWPKHVGLQAHLFPPHLTKLCLFKCRLGKDPMPELEQLQNLEILELFFYDDYPEDGEQTMTMTCSAGGFPQLQQLVLYSFKTVKEFSIAPGAMPMLKKLTMYSFSGMKNIPELQHLEMLQEFVWNDAPFFKEEIQTMIEENQHKLQHIPSVTIRDGY